MRPLYHPSLDEITVEGILYALSDPVRARIIIQLTESKDVLNCSACLCPINPLPKSTLSQHFKILRESGLIRSERKGVELHNTLRCKEIESRFGPLVSSILKAYQENIQA